MVIAEGWITNSPELPKLWSGTFCWSVFCPPNWVAMATLVPKRQLEAAASLEGRAGSIAGVTTCPQDMPGFKASPTPKSSNQRCFIVRQS